MSFFIQYGQLRASWYSQQRFHTEMLKHWAACQGNVERQNELIKRIVERVYVQDEMVVAMTLKSDYHW